MDRRGERGAALVEGALLIGIFLIPLVLGLVDVSRALYVGIAVEEAAQEGAVFGAYQADTLSGPSDVVDQIVDSQGTFPDLSTNTSIVVTCTNVTRTDAPGSVVTVSITYGLDLLTPFFTNIDITRTADAEGFTACW